MNVNITKDSGQEGFTFIEILVFVSIVSVLFISLTSVVITSLHRMQVVEHRLYAQRYGEELIEWLRAEKETDWDRFLARDTNGTGTVYCFNDPIDFINQNWDVDGPTSGECLDYNGITGTTQPIYKRFVVLTKRGDPPTQIGVQVVVEWQDGNQFFSAPLTTIFTEINDN